MKGILKKTLHTLGYDLVRRAVNNTVKGDFWKEWFNHFPVELTNCYISNRNHLKKIQNWLSEDIYNNSYWGYGVPKDFFTGKYKYSLNFNSHEFTYSDLLVAIGRKLDKVNFFEIGVSAGKNFYQMYTGLENATLYGMDIEEMNPVLSVPLSNEQLIWKSEQPYNFTNARGEVVKKIYTLRKFQFKENNNTIYYLSGDKFNNVLWDNLKGIKFNIIFSDAFHKPESIRDEFEVLKNFDLIDKENFLMVWDDLGNAEMQSVFLNICEELTSGIFQGKKSMFRLYDLHGTYAGVHKIGLFCSFQNPDLSEYLKG